MMAVLERAASGNANLAGLPPNTLAAFRSALDPDPRKRCTSEQLLHAIALDALNPFAWQTSDSTDLFGSTTGADASEVVHPFDVPLPEGMQAPSSSSMRQTAPARSAALNRLAQRNQPGNLRADWDATTDDGGDSGFVAATMALSPEQCTVALPSDYLGPEQATRPIAAAGTAAVADGRHTRNARGGPVAFDRAHHGHARYGTSGDATDATADAATSSANAASSCTTAGTAIVAAATATAAIPGQSG